ncbi:hypothetical protein ACFQ4K_28890 [Tistrella bauzanensis]
MAGHLRAKDFLEQGLRFILIQKWSLAETRRAALARAGAAGFFQPLGADGAPKLVLDAVDDRLIARLARHCDVDLKPHSYWQFYLSTSLGSCNLLHALAARPDRALALWGPPSRPRPSGSRSAACWRRRPRGWGSMPERWRAAWVAVAALPATT